MFKLASNPSISPDSVGGVVACESNSIRFADIPLSLSYSQKFTNGKSCIEVKVMFVAYICTCTMYVESFSG